MAYKGIYFYLHSAKVTIKCDHMNLKLLLTAHTLNQKLTTGEKKSQS